MPDPTPSAPEVTPNASTTPAEPPPPSNLVSTILGLISEEPAKKPEPTPEPEKKPEPTPPPPAPEPEKKPEPEPAKVTVAKKATPQVPVEDIVRKTVEELRKAETPKPVVEEKPEAPEPETVDTVAARLGFALTPEEKEEIDLALYAEQVDPSKAGLTKRLEAFYKEQKEFLDRKTAEDENYDPDSDPEYRKLITKSNPKFSSSEKRKLELRREVEAAEKRAYERARKDLMPEIEQTRRKVAEIEIAPELSKTVSSFSKALFDGAQNEALKAYSTATDLEAFKKDYPEAADIIVRAQKASEVAAKEFLAIRRGLVDFDPEKNKDHAAIAEFVEKQGEIFAAHGGDARLRGGKVFVPPSQWSPEIADRAWTFSDQDVLNALRVHTRKNVEKRLQAEQQKWEAVQEARARRTKSSAPNGATPPPPAPDDTKPVRSGVTSVATPASAPAPESNITSRILGLST